MTTPATAAAATAAGSVTQKSHSSSSISRPEAYAPIAKNAANPRSSRPA
ncbi:hypothetical protein LUX33_02775 [Actinomadura madurae]|nr:hypothetical protein [Actinomadura madurae]MCP9947488.1 hypothetical protein [Actinomadura madurae]